jgi:predicted nucleic acid-binding protein
VLVLDASVAVVACGVEDGFGPFGQEELMAPPLLWSEATSAFHELMWRRELDRDQAEMSLSRLRSMPVHRRSHRRLSDEAWSVAEELGWAKTYDAEYVALARLLRCRLVTLDARLRRGADRLGIVVTPQEYLKSARR